MARYRGSLSSVVSSGGGGDSRRHSWRPNAAASFDGWRTPSVIIGPSASSHTCCGSGTGGGGGSGGGATLLTTRATWSSMPSSPTHVQPPSAAMIARLQGGPKRSRSRVTFQGKNEVYYSFFFFALGFIFKNELDYYRLIFDRKLAYRVT